MKGLKEVVELLKIKFQVFTSLRYNVSHTSVTFYQLFSNLDESIVKIQDFSENYTCLLQQEIMSLQSNQEQATVFLIITLKKYR